MIEWLYTWLFIVLVLGLVVYVTFLAERKVDTTHPNCYCSTDKQNDDTKG